MDPEDSDRVKDLIKERKWEGLSFVDESRRFYPNGSMAANVLGFVGMDDKGLDGLEMSLDSLIRGGSNKQQILTDARDPEVSTYSIQGGEGTLCVPDH